jgi:transposase
MPADIPPWDRVYAFFRRRRETGLLSELHDRLRDRVRRAEGRDAELTAAVVDSQSMKADTTSRTLHGVTTAGGKSTAASGI